jgi:hydrogenase maturation protease
LTKNTNSKQSDNPLHILIYGYGNPGRQDDALGLRLVEFTERWAKDKHLQNIETDQNYQLNIEDAERISGFDLVIFCDASVEVIKHVRIEEVVPDLRTDFSMHSVNPSFIVGLCHRIFNKYPETYQLQIKGHSWEFMQDMTKLAEENLKKAQDILTRFLLEKCKLINN